MADKVGIGTTEPAEMLTVWGGKGSFGSAYSGGRVYVGDDDGTNVKIYTDGTRNLRFQAGSGKILYDADGSARDIYNKASSAIDTGNSAITYFGTSFANISTPNMSITLPSAGTYLIFANLRVVHDGNINAFGVVQLYNNTTSAVISNTIRMIIEIANTGIEFIVTMANPMWLVTVTAENSISLQGKCYNAADTVGLSNDSNGFNEIGYIKLF
ncbi:MAG: hypothetical protein A2297_10220 [Elusimicrobia bacterium RIFOXYB2_FULL_48_7]|nr:MAG: hypothetical protein A2297_10220 [Elusimicrobia bacterium RIFOXYB2_FULL_48_7]